jgi:hypothetical protein
LIALPIVGWGLSDVKRFHRYEWFGYGRPSTWRTALVVSYALGGWPVFLVAFTWRTSLARRAMMEQRSDRRRSRDNS